MGSHVTLLAEHAHRGAGGAQRRRLRVGEPVRRARPRPRRPTATTLSPRTPSFDRSTSSVASPACAIIVRLTSASSASASVITPCSVRPLTLRNSRSAKCPSTVRTANGPTNERVSRRSVPPTPISSHVRAALAEDQLHHREAVREHGDRRPLLDHAPRDEVARRRRVEEDGLARREQRDRRGGEPLLGRGLDRSRRANESSCAEVVGSTRAAVRAAQHAAPLELVEVAARGHRRDAEAALHVGDRDRPVRAQRLGDRAPARLGEQRAAVAVVVRVRL